MIENLPHDFAQSGALSEDGTVTHLYGPAHADGSYVDVELSFHSTNVAQDNHAWHAWSVRPGCAPLHLAVGEDPEDVARRACLNARGLSPNRVDG